MKVRVDATGQEIDVPDEQAGVLASKGGFSFPQGTAIPIKHSDGSVEQIPVEQYWQNQRVLTAATPEDIQAHTDAQAKIASDAQEAQLDAQYGNDLATAGRAGLEGAARAVTLGLSDAGLAKLGADPTGLRERAERNPMSALAGEAIGTLAPLILTGGESGIVQGLARATPVALADGIGVAVGKKVAQSLGEGFTARLAAGTANMAAQGALAGVGGEISARSLNNEALLDPNTMNEYLLAAGQGALIGGALGAGGHLIGEAAGAGLRLGGKAVEAGKGLYSAARAGIEAPVREAEAGVQSAIGADYEGEVRAAQQRLSGLTLEDLSAPERAVSEARAKAEAAAPTGSVLPGAAGARADSPLSAIGARVTEEATALGVPEAATRSAWERIEQGKQAFDTAEETHAASVKTITALGDELEKVGSHTLDEVDLSRRNSSLREALATDRTASPPDQFYGAMVEQHAKIRNALSEFRSDPDPQIQSWTKRLDKFLAKNEGELGALDPKEAATRADAFEILDQSNRIIGKVRAKIGDRTQMGIGTLSDTLAGLYEDTRQLLKNPNVVGDRVAAISGRAKSSWSDLFDVWGGYRKALTRENAGGERSLSGFDTVDRYDPAKVSALLKNIDHPETQLDLELVGRGLDSQAKLMDHFEKDLQPGGQASKNIARYKELSGQIADELVKYRSKVALAREYASAAAPALKEMSGLEEKLAAARAKAEEKLASHQAKAQAGLEKEQEKAGMVREKSVSKAQEKLAKAQEQLGGGIRGAILDGALTTLGGHVGGFAGALIGHNLVKAVSNMSTPLIRALGTAGLTGAMKTGTKMAQFDTAMAVGRRLSKATLSIGDALRSGKPLAGAAKIAAMRARRDTPEAYKKAVDDVQRSAQTDARAAYLSTLLPAANTRLQLRPDLDTTPTVSPLEQRKFLRSVRAVNDPVGVLEAFAHGAGTREGATALRTLYPALYQRSVGQIMQHASELKKKPSMNAQRHLSMLIGSPLHFTVHPDFIRFAQNTYGATAAAGQSHTDMLKDSNGPAQARQINSKVAGQMQTPGQRLESGQPV